jgi:sugar diacid utilization regulator
MPAYASPVPAYSASPSLAEQVAAYTERHVRLFVRTARRGRPPAGKELDFVRERGARRARELIPLEAVLKIHHLGQRLHWEAITEAAAPTAAGMEAALSLTFFTFEYAIAVNGAVAEGYLQERYLGMVDAERARRDVLEALLTPDRGAYEELSARAALLGVEFGHEHVLAATVVSGAGSEITPQLLRQAADTLGRRAHSRADHPFTVVRHDEVVAIVPLGHRDPTEVAEAVAKATAEADRRYGVTMLAGVSAPFRSPDEVARAYAQGRRALAHARARGMPVALEEVGVFEELTASAGPFARAMIPAGARVLAQRDAANGGVLAETIVAYAEADLNVSRAAERLGVHPNTVHYRLTRIGELSGRDPRRFADLVELVTALRLLEPEHARAE